MYVALQGIYQILMCDKVEKKEDDHNIILASNLKNKIFDLSNEKYPIENYHVPYITLPLCLLIVDFGSKSL